MKFLLSKIFIKNIFTHFRNNIKIFYIGLIFLVLSGALQLTLPPILGKTFSQTTQQLNFDSKDLQKNLIILVFVFILQYILTFIRNYFFNNFAEKSIGSIRKSLFKKYMHLPFSFHRKNKTGDLMSRLSGDVFVVRDLYSTQLSDVLHSVFLLLFSVVILFSINVKLTLILISVFPFVMFVATYFSGKIKKNSVETQAFQASCNSIIEEDLAHIRTIKLFGNEDQEVKRFSQEIDAVIQKSIKNSLIRSTFVLSTSFLVVLAMVLNVFYAFLMVAMGELTVAEIITFVFNMVFIINAFSSISNFFGSLQRSKGATARILEILNEKDEHGQKKEMIENFKSKINIENLSLSFEENGHDILKNISFEIKKGEKVAIVGNNGAGKSSLINTLIGLISPSEGNIYIDDVKVNTISPESYRKIFGVVSQDIEIFNRSIYENIIFGTDLDPKRLKEVLKISNCEEILASLNTDLHVALGKNGNKLSGGQRQRVALARSLYKNADIIIFDEATSSIDAMSEHLIYQNLKDILEEKTLMAIVHDFSRIKDYDKIIVLHKGQIEAIGDHQSLINSGCIPYIQLYDKQFKQDKKIVAA
ncbi:ABC transporter ATP-binding protein [Sphingobacterium sp. GVS05A]|uniref:ABC transporter ATP-binding protein n=1 Tax=Sphingobacterium sp. GVS05A TaxID=2862679 RepID=UPI001CBADB44|nr:ABC transporter ATP-binding protein [Sphingobacterium sp. GVS05A]